MIRPSSSLCVFLWTPALLATFASSATAEQPAHEEARAANAEGTAGIDAKVSADPSMDRLGQAAVRGDASVRDPERLGPQRPHEEAPPRDVESLERPAEQAPHRAAVKVAAQEAEAARHVASEVQDRAAVAGMSAQRELRLARGRAAVERARCLDVLLTRIHMAEKQAGAMQDALEEAIHLGQPQRVEQQRVRLGWLGLRVERLKVEIAACGRVPTPELREDRVVQHVPRLPPIEAFPRSAPAAFPTLGLSFPTETR